MDGIFANMTSKDSAKDSVAVVYLIVVCLFSGLTTVGCMIPDMIEYHGLVNDTNKTSAKAMSVELKDDLSPKVRVGICLPEWEKRRLKITGLIGETIDVSIKDIDMERSIEEQGPFDIIFHKILKWFDKDAGKGRSYLNKLLGYHSANNHVTLIDPIENGIKLANRSLTLELAKQCEFTLGNRSVFLPKYLFLKNENITAMKEMIRNAGIKYPIIAKKLIGKAGLSESHDMRIVFSEENLKDLSLPCVVQEFLNHGGKMFKVYVIGDKFYTCEKPSVRNLHASDKETLFFDSTNITKGEYFPKLHEKDPSAINFATSDNKELLDGRVISFLIQKLRMVLDFNMLGIDIIIDERTQNYGIIDLNYSPSFHCVMSHFPVDLLEVFINIRKRLKSTARTS
ncbi:inositol-tetrakisphosphate 1-kinase-like [Rhopilema esculentum]|uniref:inositol-tetrakisphosphate 1-kinase-like n=1 Tax=Rhopilema esculentum TaxID=499914 RepID=UPI0031E3BA2E|eukprot:gene11390-21588_t